MIVNRLKDLAMATICKRQIGKTTKLIQMCKELNGVFICANSCLAKKISEQYGVKAVSKEHNLRGMTGPFILDHYVVELEFYNAASEIEKLRNENQKLREAIKFYSQKDNFCLYDDISEAEWKDNWIGERYSQFVLSPIGRKAREALNESEEG